MTRTYELHSEGQVYDRDMYPLGWGKPTDVSIRACYDSITFHSDDELVRFEKSFGIDPDALRGPGHPLWGVLTYIDPRTPSESPRVDMELPFRVVNNRVVGPRLDHLYD